MPKLWLAVVALLFQVNSYAQSGESKKKGYRVEILNAKSLKRGRTNDHQKLVGSVILRQGSVKLFCDSAEINQLNHDFAAWGKVFINKGDSIKAWGDSLLYDGVEEKARLIGNAKLVEGPTNLTTNVLFMDQKNDLFYYLQPGIIVSDSTTITSNKGFYYTSSSMINLQDSVVVKSPQYTIKADSLDYYSNSKRAVFKGPTNIFLDKDEIYCEGGMYDSNKKIAEFTKNAVIKSEENTLRADSIFTDQNSEISKAYDNVVLVDTINQVEINGHYGFFNKKKNLTTVSDSALLIQFMDQDTLYIHGDTIRGLEDLLQQKSFYVYKGVRMFKNDIQTVCDSLSYSFSDSLIRMMQNPILWSGSNQLTGDTISIFTYDNSLKKMYINGNSMIVSEVDSAFDFYDQIKGKNMVGYFANNDLSKMMVNGNGQTLYYAQEEDSTFTGVNVAECSNIKIAFTENEIDKIVFLKKPEATFFPLKKFPVDQSKMEGFNWYLDQRPTSQMDVFRKVKAN